MTVGGFKAGLLGDGKARSDALDVGFDDHTERAFRQGDSLFRSDNRSVTMDGVALVIAATKPTIVVDAREKMTTSETHHKEESDQRYADHYWQKRR